ncbi:T9SS type A sorting domain-containing protein [Kordia algicida OT-1]|uniref:Secretion system C-terminal sorting domain-containing protein n=1 Tax=Kordia algicida OT-1 TaxID=391587 RepID=A9DN14_9FLAO|nr:T9SS type A sorting domain-containing protein [Kordia algicida]EDP97092.1 hypothetical protein KAOT1_18057 [Kordia algicida OT-1]
MKKLLLTTFFCLYIFCVHAQCNISPFIQQNYELDAKLLVLREISNDDNDPDRHNPFLSQSRVDGYLEKLSGIYENLNNEPEIDSLFNEFQFHVNKFLIRYKRIQFRVDTNVSWVQNLKDTGMTNVTTIDNFLNQYQFSVQQFTDITSGTHAGKTSFVLNTAFDALNVKAIEDDFYNTSPAEIEIINGGTMFENPCNYTGILYVIPDTNSLGDMYDVSKCDIYAPGPNSNGAFTFVLGAFCPDSVVTQMRYVTISNDCSQINFSRTLSIEEAELTNVSIYPNPASSVLNIQGIANIKTIEAHNIQGKKVAISPNNFTQIDISSLQNGIYFLKVVDDQNRSVIKKFIKQ